MSYQSMTDPSRKFGSAFRGKRFDAYHGGGEQPAGNNENEKAEPKEVKSPATSFHFTHDHDGGKHTTTTTREDGTSEVVSHGSAKEAHDSAAQLALEAGGEKQNENVKRSDHPDQMGARSEEEGYEQPVLV